MDNLKISKEEMDAIIKELQRSPGSLAESQDIDMMQGKYPKPTPSLTPSPTSTPSTDKDYQMSPEELTGLAKDIYKNMGLGKYKESTPTPAPSPFGPEMSPEMKLRKVLENMNKSGEKFINRSPSSVTPYDKAYPMPSKLNLSNKDIQDMLKSGEFTPPFTQPTPSDSKMNRSPDSDINFMEAYNPQLNEKTPLSNEELINMMRENQSYLPQDKNLDNEPVLPFNNIRGTINRSR